MQMVEYGKIRHQPPEENKIIIIVAYSTYPNCKSNIPTCAIILGTLYSKWIGPKLAGSTRGGRFHKVSIHVANQPCTLKGLSLYRWALLLSSTSSALLTSGCDPLVASWLARPSIRPQLSACLRSYEDAMTTDVYYSSIVCLSPSSIIVEKNIERTHPGHDDDDD